MKRPIPGLMIDAQPADTLAAMLIYGEARDQYALAAAGVLFVALNRAYPDRDKVSAYFAEPETLREVILKKRQFSCFNEDDKNRPKLLTAYKDDAATWGWCWALAELVLAGGVADPTHGATHYVLEKRPDGSPMWGSQGLGWFQEQEISAGRTIKTVQLGAHVFARAPGKFV